MMKHTWKLTRQVDDENQICTSVEEIINNYKCDVFKKDKEVEKVLLF